MHVSPSSKMGWRILLTLDTRKIDNETIALPRIRVHCTPLLFFAHFDHPSALDYLFQSLSIQSLCLFTIDNLASFKLVG